MALQRDVRADTSRESRRALRWLRAAALAAAIAACHGAALAQESGGFAVIRAADLADFHGRPALQPGGFAGGVFDLRDQLLVQERERALRKAVRALRRGNSLSAQLQFDRAVRAEERRRDVIALPNPGALGVIVPLAVRRPVIVIGRRCCD